MGVIATAPTIRIGDTQFSDWDRVEIVNGLSRKTAYASVRSFNKNRIVAMGGDSMSISEAHRQGEENLATFSHNGNDIMAGYANLFRSSLTESEDVITAEFRSQTQDIVDSSVGKRPGIGDAFGNTTKIGEAVAYLLEGSGVAVTYDNPDIRNLEIDKFKPSPQATVMSEIVRVASEARQTVYDAGIGGIVVADLSKRDVAGVLTEDNFDYTSFVVEVDNSGIYNRYTAVNHKPDDGEDAAADIGTDFFGGESGSSSDATSFSLAVNRQPQPFPGRRRLFHTTVPQRASQSEVESKFNYDINRTHASILTVNIQAWQWDNPAGNLWRVGDIYRVKFDSRRVDMEMMLSNLVLSHDSGGQVAQLTLTDARAWAAEYTIKTNAKQTVNEKDYFQAR